MLQHRPPNTTALQLTWQYMLQNCMPNRIEILYGLMLDDDGDGDGGDGDDDDGDSDGDGGDGDDDGRWIFGI